MTVEISARVKVKHERGFIEHRGGGWFRLVIDAMPEAYDYSNWSKAGLQNLRDAIDDALRETATYETMIRSLRERAAAADASAEEDANEH